MREEIKQRLRKIRGVLLQGWDVKVHHPDVRTGEMLNIFDPQHPIR